MSISVNKKAGEALTNRIYKKGYFINGYLLH